MKPLSSGEPARMRQVALDAIAPVTGGPADRWGRSQLYITPNDKLFHLRTRQRDEQRSGWVRYWFGIQDDCWTDPTDFFVLVCHFDFVLVVPVSEWLPYMDRFSVSKRGTPLQARQPHIYWRNGVYELREGLREPMPLILDVKLWVDNFELLR